MKAAIFTNRNQHVIRLVQGLQSIEIEAICVKDPKELSSSPDFIFIDPSFEKEIPNSYFEGISLFFDCEDDPYHFDPGPAYELYKDKVHAYAKMIFTEEDKRKDGLKNIGFPITPFMELSKVHEVEPSPFSSKQLIPYLVCTGTFLGNYPINPEILKKYPFYYKHLYNKDIKYLAELPTENTVLYSQRIQWFLDLEKDSIPYKGGLVFREGTNLSKEWQQKHFGKDVTFFETNPVSRQQYLEELLFHSKIALCPTGHERISWRIFDIMATGAIPITTEFKGRKYLYNPEFIIEVEDEAPLATELASIMFSPGNNTVSYLEDAKKNREVLANLTPAKIFSDFISQI